MFAIQGGVYGSDHLTRPKRGAIFLYYRQGAESREQRAESREQRAESREQRAESREQRAENGEQRSEIKRRACIKEQQI
jgi:hypothetical protein